MAQGTEAVAEVLGLARTKNKALSTLSLIAAVEKGLPVTALDRIAQRVAPADASFRFRLVSKATLARRKQAAAKQRQSGNARNRPKPPERRPASRAGVLSAQESARIARLAKVWAFAVEVWGDDVAARDFLFRAHPLLEGRRPIDVVLGSEFGAPLVEDMLGGLQYGSAA